MSKKLNISREDLIEQLGEVEAMKLITNVESVKFSRKDIKKIEEKLNEEGKVTIRRLKTNPSKFEFVSQEFVHITRQYNFQNPTALKKAMDAKVIK